MTDFRNDDGYDRRMKTASRGLGPLAWVPSAYFAEGIPFAMVLWVAGTMFKDLGHSDSQITLATASIGIVWSLKPLWSSLLDMHRTKKFWVLLTEFIMCALLAAAAIALQSPYYFGTVIFSLWLLALASATQDICIDGVYITTLPPREQARFIGVQGMCWNTGRIFATAAVVWVASRLKSSGCDARTAWMYALGLSSITMGALGAYHSLALPAGSIPVRPKSVRRVFDGYGEAFSTFFRKKAIWGMLLFVVFYRFGEGFLLIEAPLFMQSSRNLGGLGLTLAQKSMIDGTLSTAVNIAGGLMGGAFVSRYGLKRTLLVLAICLNVPHACYVALSQAVSADHGPSMTAVMLLVCVEKFGYGFGFVGNMLYMMQELAPGKFKMTHYAFATALMNLVLVPTQILSGPLADWMGYKSYFAFVLLASIPSIVVAWIAPFPDHPDPESNMGVDVPVKA
jgi:PAT family beta-lactamase induction signal transducer AmpG